VDFFVGIFGFLDVVLRGVANAAQAMTLGGIIFLFVMASPPPGGEAADARLDRRLRSVIAWSAGVLALVEAAELMLKVLLLLGTVDVTGVEAATSNFAIAGAVIVAGRHRGPSSRRRRRPAAPRVRARDRARGHPQQSCVGAARSPRAADGRGGAAPDRGGGLDRRHPLSPDHAQTRRRLARDRAALLAGVHRRGGNPAHRRADQVVVLYRRTRRGVRHAYGDDRDQGALLFVTLVPSARSTSLRCAVRRRARRGARRGAGRRSSSRWACGVLRRGIDDLDAAGGRPARRPRDPSPRSRRSTPRWPHLTSPSHAALAPGAAARARRRAQATGTAPQRAHVPGAGIPTPTNPEDIWWSEFNHHWAGAFVFLIGIMSLVERTGRAKWARAWPLVFIALAIFLMIRSDPRAWPLGDVGFFEVLLNPEALQHRVFTLLIAVFGVFEWLVRIGRIKNRRGALVFPVFSMFGAGFLLAHSHDIVKSRKRLVEQGHAFCRSPCSACDRAALVRAARAARAPAVPAMIGRRFTLTACCYWLSRGV
jgi:putative copper resistance protein D